MLKTNNYSILLILTLFFYLDNVYGSTRNVDETNLSSKVIVTSLSYRDYKNLTSEQYIALWSSNISQDKQEQYKNVFTTILQSPEEPIDEGNPANALSIVVKESGYSFPPLKTIQGPLLSFCSEGTRKKVILDIGAGNGNDTICMLLTHKVQIISVDIHETQLARLKSRVTQFLKPHFPALLDKNYFCTLEKDFSKEETVPEKYINKIDGINVSRVLHFLDNKQTQTMFKNCAKMLKDEGHIFITAFAVKPGSHENNWIELQKTKKDKDPYVIYYDTVSTYNVAGAKVATCMKLVENENDKLSDPGKKIEFLTVNNNGTTKEHTLRQGRHYFTSETLTAYLSPSFTVIDSIMYSSKNEYYISVIAKRVKR